MLKESDERFILETFIPLEKAREVIGLFNMFRQDRTSMAFRKLFHHFVWKPNGMEPLDHNPLAFMEIIPDSPPLLSTGRHKPLPSTPSEHGEFEDDIDGIHTAATDGFTLWINSTKIMNRAFDKKDTHFGPLPQSVSHFAAVMLHEFGHILRKRAGRTTVETMFRQNPALRECYNEFRQRISKAREGYRRGFVDDEYDYVKEASDELEEWFADIYAKSFILYAFGKG